MYRKPIFLLSFPVLFLLFLISFSVKAQTEQEIRHSIDSLKKAVRFAKNDSTKVSAYVAWDKLIYFTDPITDKKLNTLVKELCLRNLKKKNIAITLRHYFKKQLASAYSNIGNIYEAEGNYPEAITNLLKSLKLHEEMKSDAGLAAIYTNLGAVYKTHEHSDKAFNYFKLALKHDLKTGDSLGIAGSLMNLGVFYSDNNQHELALTHFRKALKICSRLKNAQWNVAAGYNNIGSVYTSLRNQDSAYVYYKKALDIRLKLGDKWVIAGTYFNIAGVYHDKKEYKKAIEIFDQGIEIASEIRFNEILKLSYEGKSKTYSESGDYNKAFENYKLFILYRDSLKNEENTKKVVQSQMQYEFDKKVTAAKARQEKKDALVKAEKERQQIILILVCGALTLVVLFSVFVFRSLRKTKKQKLVIEAQKKEVEAQKLLVEEKQKEILDSIRYAKRIQIALLPSDKYIRKSIGGK